MGATAFQSDSSAIPLIDVDAEDAVRAFHLLGGRKVINQTVRKTLCVRSICWAGAR